MIGHVKGTLIYHAIQIDQNKKTISLGIENSIDYLASTKNTVHRLFSFRRASLQIELQEKHAFRYLLMNRTNPSKVGTPSNRTISIGYSNRY